ncbi:MAG: PHP domain-containing protein [Cyanobacteria bacterium RUI128]|nr:PHP domain-containing protein [Cyanobacteria bacterium RUI128]
MIKADLHIHSNCSDGSDTVGILAEKILHSDLNITALTDHDTTDGLEEMGNLLEGKIKFIKGIELTCLAGNIKCHILGYNINPKSEELKQLIAKGKILRRKKLDTRINYLKEVWNIELTPGEREWLYSRKSVVKTHLANILVKRGLAEGNIPAMKKYLDGCKTGNTRFDGQEAIDTIKAAGGIVVWAHPLGGEGEKHISKEEFLKQLEQMKIFGIDGIECHYSRYNEDEVKLLTDIAKEHNLYISGGSDYHGANKDIPLGRMNTDDKEIDAENLTILQKLFK